MMTLLALKLLVRITGSSAAGKEFYLPKNQTRIVSFAVSFNFNSYLIFFVSLLSDNYFQGKQLRHIMTT